MAYALGELGATPISVPTIETMPVVVDDMSLSYQLGINNWALWYFLRQCNSIAGTSDSCYSIIALSKRGRAGKRGKVRKTYVASPRIRDIQDAILSRFVMHIPVGDWVGAYEPGRSTIATAKLCSGKAIVAQLDLKGFFPTIKRAWVRDLFESYGYTRYISNLLAGLLCTTEQYTSKSGQTRLRHFLPQGSAAAPFISNRVAERRFDTEVVSTLEGTGFSYVRYSDNIYITKDDLVPREAVDKMLREVRGIIHKAGWRTHKVRVDLRWRRQKVLGLVVNEKTNLPKEQYYALKATLFNCAKNGFTSELARAREATKKDLPSVTRFIAHLRGRLSYASQVLCESRVTKLRGYMDEALAKYKDTLSKESGIIVDENLLSEPVQDLLKMVAGKDSSAPSSEASDGAS